MRRDLVVCHFNEDLAWLDELGPEWNVRVNHKGDCRPHRGTCCVLRDIGLDAYSILTYLADEYDDVADLVAFVQGRPFDHSSNVVGQLARLSKDESPPAFGWLSTWKVMSGRRPDHYLRENAPGYEEAYLRVLGADGPTDFSFGAGAMFFVTKERIRQRPRRFYDMMLDAIEDETETHGPTAYHYERMWAPVFFET